jgi:hypothetical protein
MLELDGNISKTAAKSSTAIQSVAPLKSPATLQAPPASLEDILIRILEVEALKQISPPLTDQQRGLLAKALAEHRWTPEVLAARARAVVWKNTFGRITPDVWLNQSDDVVSRQEYDTLKAYSARQGEIIWAKFEDAVADAVTVRARAARSLSKELRDPAMNELLAAQDDLRLARLEQRDALARLEADKVGARRKCSAFLRSLGPEDRALVMREALKEGVFEVEDGFVLENLHVFAGELVDIVERIKFQVQP